MNEAKNWLFEAQYEDKHSIAGKAPQMTVDEWFNFWITEYKEKTTRFNTVIAYRESYKNNIKDVIGKMIISEVLPMHCQKVLKWRNLNWFSEFVKIGAELVRSSKKNLSAAKS